MKPAKYFNKPSHILGKKNMSSKSKYNQYTSNLLTSIFKYLCGNKYNKIHDINR